MFLSSNEYSKLLHTKAPEAQAKDWGVFISAGTPCFMAENGDSGTW